MRFTSLTGACLVLVYCTLLPQEIESYVFRNCELARYLATHPGVQRADIPTWVCIAKEGSNFNSRTLTMPIRNGSRNWGLFQINDRHWCVVAGKPGKGCNALCSQFEDDGIDDDITCAVHVLAETRRLQGGNGFEAWAAYEYCDTPEKVLPNLKHCAY